MKITRQDDRGGAVLNWAVRYALGRYSYAPSLAMALNVDKYRDELMQAISEKGQDLIWCAVWAVRSNGAECGGMKCNTCRNKSVAWLFQEADPALLKNGEGLNPRRPHHGA